MVGFAGASAGLAYLIKPVLDDVLIRQIRLQQVALAIIVLYLAKGLFSFFSTFLMSFVGQRTVMDLRNRLYRHVLGQSLGFFKMKSTLRRLVSRILPTRVKTIIKKVFFPGERV